MTGSAPATGNDHVFDSPWIVTFSFGSRVCAAQHSAGPSLALVALAQRDALRVGPVVAHGELTAVA